VRKIKYLKDTIEYELALFMIQQIGLQNAEISQSQIEGH